jgi:hypothetical protein
MIPGGYLLKRTVPPPGWLQPQTDHVVEVCSVADCVNDNIADPQDTWNHNGFGLANDPEMLFDTARQSGIDLSGARMFYYAVHEMELPSDGWTFDPRLWQEVSRAASSSVPDDVAVLDDETDHILLGYDVVVFGDFLEHSPLSCNSIATELPVNRHCLFDTFETAKSAIDTGKFGKGCEEGIYKIFSVYELARF